MVKTTGNKLSKIDAKIPVSKSKNAGGINLKVPLSPTISEVSLDDEVLALRAQNKVLAEALKAVKESAVAQAKKNYDLVWYAKYRYRYPIHEASKRIETSQEYQEELDKLKTNDADFHHGFHTGVMAAARMFRDQADIVHITEHKEVSNKMMTEATKHFKRIEESKLSFPDLAVEGFPTTK